MTIYKSAKTEDESINKVTNYMSAAIKHTNEGTEQWKQGKDCYRQMCAAVTAKSLAMISMTKAPLSALTSSLQFMPSDPVFGEIGKMISQHCYGGALPPNIITEFASSFIHLKSVEDTKSPAWFHISNGLLWALHNTDLKHVTAGHIKMPFKAFFFSIPSDVFYIKDTRTGFHQARYIGIAEDHHESWGKGVGISIHCEPNNNSVDLFDDHIATMWIPLFGEDVPLEMLINFNRYKSEVMYDLWDQIVEINDKGLVRYKLGFELIIANEVIRRLITNEPFKGDRGVPFETKHRDICEELRTKMSNNNSRNTNNQSDETSEEFVIFGKKYIGYDRWSALSAIVINALLYINSVSLYKQHVHAEKIDELKKKFIKLNGKKGKALAKSSTIKKIKELSSINEWFIGTDIIIDPEGQIPKHVTGESEGRTLKFPSITRGHWRHQAHGPRHSLRKLIWIAPFIRGKQLGTPDGHHYHVKP